MSAVVLDIGNTSVKVGLFNNHSKLEKKWTVDQLQIAKSIIQEYAPTKVAICSVVHSNQQLIDQLDGIEALIVDQNTSVPISNDYNTKETLGVDRIAAVVGAENMKLDSDVLVIDIGTCLTYDFLDKNNCYQGGGISPGIELRLKSMYDYTSKLPLIEGVFEVDLIGKSTLESMMSGVTYGLLAEIEGLILQYRSEFPDIKIVVCGGGLSSFESKIKESIFAAPDLVLEGLNRILEYNDKR